MNQYLLRRASFFHASATGSCPSSRYLMFTPAKCAPLCATAQIKYLFRIVLIEAEPISVNYNLMA